MAAGATGNKETAVTLRISKRTLRDLDQVAKKERRSRNKQIVFVLSEFIAQHKDPAPASEAMR